MKIAYFDCFSGISGDMILGALLDAGLALEDLNREIAKLGVQDVAIERESTARHAIAATRAKVCVAGAPVVGAEHHLDLSGERTHAHAHAHAYLKDITSRIADSRLDDVVKERSIRVFERLCAAEAEVHNTAPAEVALHEVGALDALIDVVGAVAGLQLLEVDEVCASPLRFGTGFVDCAHGRYPVPVPGVLALCRDVPTEQTDIRAELVTPTGGGDYHHFGRFLWTAAALLPTGRRLWRGPPRLRGHSQSIAPALGRACVGQRARAADRSQY